MRKFHYLPALATVLILTSCNSCCRNPCEEVIEERYVHQYGLEIPPQEWVTRGQDGAVVSTLKDGTTVTKNYQSGALHGNTTYSFPHSTSVARCDQFNNGNFEKATHYYRSGAARQEIIPLSNSRRAVTTWYESGEPCSREEYEGALLDSGTYYTPDQNVESTVQEGNGIRIKRDGYGQLQAREQISQGEAVEVTTYHSNGAPKEVIPQVNGLAHGTVRAYLPDGEPSNISEWKMGVKDGITTVYENGEIVARIPFSRGVENGIEERYRDGSEVATRVTWFNGVKHGPTYHYAGSNTTIDWYFQDKAVSKGDFDMFTNYPGRTRILNQS